MDRSAGETPLYDVDAASFVIGGRTIVDKVDLKLLPGRVHGLVGPNGSGKSSLIKLMARQRALDRGAIRLRGRDLSAYGDREFAQNVAYLPQFTPPAEGMSVRELVGLGRFPWHGALGRFTEADAGRVEDALARTQLTAFADRMVDNLSGGERQRAWLAMMVAQDAGCLLLDEPTSALDVAHQVDMLALIRELGLSNGISVLVVLHDINMAARYCDEIIAMRDGCIVAHGAPAEIVDAGVLDRIYGIAMGTMTHPVTGVPVSYVL